MPKDVSNLSTRELGRILERGSYIEYVTAWGTKERGKVAYVINSVKEGIVISINARVSDKGVHSSTFVVEKPSKESEHFTRQKITAIFEPGEVANDKFSYDFA